MCPTCEKSHPFKPAIGLNVCLSDSQLHQFHLLKKSNFTCPPDSLHVDWVTIPGASIPILETANSILQLRFCIDDQNS